MPTWRGAGCNALAVVAVTGGKVLVLHGGLFSKTETCLDDLRNIGISMLCNIGLHDIYAPPCAVSRQGPRPGGSASKQAPAFSGPACACAGAASLLCAG